MTEKEFHDWLEEALDLKGELANPTPLKDGPLGKMIKLSPYFIFVYPWEFVNFSGVSRVVTATEVMMTLRSMRFPPIGKN